MNKIFIEYGSFSALSNSQLLMDYGFICDDNHNSLLLYPYHFPSTISDYETKIELLQMANIDIHNNYFVISKEEFPEDLVTAVRIEKLSPNDIYQSLIRSKLINKKRISLTNELETFSHLITHTTQLLSKYGTSVTQDQELLTSSSLTSRYRIALILRLEEKNQLHLLLSRLNYFKSKLEQAKAEL